MLRQAIAAAQATMLRNMQQLIASGKAPPGISAATLALMQARMAMMSSMGMPLMQAPTLSCSPPLQSMSSFMCPFRMRMSLAHACVSHVL